jgi:hypothetical protein
VTVHSHSLPERYGAPPRWRRFVLIGLVVVVVVSFGALWTWITIVQSDPPVSSELITSEIVNDHEVTAVIRVKWGGDPVDAKCSVRAIARDKEVVGELAFEPDPDAGPDYSVEISTARRATAVENVGCTADGQPRPR